jgi:TetR/AcrR family transcriptional repressor of nem operon
MAVERPRPDRKEQIVSAAIDRLCEVGFEGFRLGDVAKDVGINNATLIHHYPSKVALIKAVVEGFTATFQAVADETNTDGSPRAKLARHMRSSFELMRTSPGMFVVLNEIMTKGRRDAEMAQLVSVPLAAWRDHIVSLISPRSSHGAIDETGRADAIATATATATVCMTQLLGIGLLSRPTDHAPSSSARTCDAIESQAIAAVVQLVEEE